MCPSAGFILQLEIVCKSSLIHLVPAALVPTMPGSSYGYGVFAGASQYTHLEKFLKYNVYHWGMRQMHVMAANNNKKVKWNPTQYVFRKALRIELATCLC